MTLGGRVQPKSPVTTRGSSNQSVFDKISALLSEIKSASNYRDSGAQFPAFILFVNKLSVQNFKDLFENNKSFYQKVMNASGAMEPGPSDEILEIFVQIPEISDFLPEPNIKTFMDIVKKKDELEKAMSPEAQFAKAAAADRVYRLTAEQLDLAKESRDAALLNAAGLVNIYGRDAEGVTSSAEDSYQRVQDLADTSLAALNNNKKRALEKPEELFNKSLLETLKIINMYPRVYKLSSGSTHFAPGQPCKVELPFDDNIAIPSMGYGIFLEILSGQAKIQGTGIQEQINKILEKEKGSN